MRISFSMISGCMVGIEWCDSEHSIIIDLFLLCIVIELDAES